MSAHSAADSQSRSREVRDEITRRIERRNRLLAIVFYGPLSAVLLIGLLAGLLFRQADRTIKPVAIEAANAPWSRDRSLEAAAEKIAATASAARLAVQTELPYPFDANEDRLVDYGSAISSAARELRTVKEILFPDRRDVAPGEIANAVRAMQRSEELGRPKTGSPLATDCLPEIEPNSRPYPIFFSVGRSDLTPATKDQLRVVLNAWREFNRPPVTLLAYSDPSGDPTFNEKLRTSRALAVHGFLKSESKGALDAKVEKVTPVPAPDYECYVAGPNEYLRVATVRFGR